MLDETFKDRVQRLVHPRFEECAERARGNYSQRSAELAAKGHVYSGATLTAQHEARVREKQEQIDIVWEALKQVAAAFHTTYSDTLADDLKAELDHYASYKLSGITKIAVRTGDEKIEQQLHEDFDAKRQRAVNKIKAEIDLFVDNLRTSPRKVETTKEYEQKFKILFSPSQARADFEKWADDLKAKSRPLALLFIDIDHFKPLNEKYTHATIDRTLLPEFMIVLRDTVCFRGEGYRYGGEEFILILPNHDGEEARAFAEKLRSSIEKHSFSIDTQTESLTISIGIAVWPQNGATYSEILQKANTAEAAAKAHRNVVVLAE